LRVVRGEERVRRGDVDNSFAEEDEEEEKGEEVLALVVGSTDK